MKDVIYGTERCGLNADELADKLKEIEGTDLAVISVVPDFAPFTLHPVGYIVVTAEMRSSCEEGCDCRRS